MSNIIVFESATAFMRPVLAIQRFFSLGYDINTLIRDFILLYWTTPIDLSGPP